MPKILEAVHHSMSDWDYEHAAGNYALDSGLYVVAPSSLRIKYGSSGYPPSCVLSKFTPTLCLPQGELRTWFRATSVGEAWCNFRNQAAVGVANRLNCYATVINPASLTLYRLIGGGSTVIGSVVITHATLTWEHWRLVWWNGSTPGGADCLSFQLYKEVAGVWVQQGATLQDTANQFKASAVNRAGLCAQTSTTYYANFDETEIWGP